MDSYNLIWHYANAFLLYYKVNSYGTYALHIYTLSSFACCHLRKMVYPYVSPLLKSNGRGEVLVLIIRICYLCAVVAIIYFLVGSRIHEVSIYPILYMLSRSTADKPLSGNVKNKAHCQNKDVMLWTCFNSNRSLDCIWFYLFCTFMLSAVFLFSIGFCSAFLDIVHHVCKKQWKCAQYKVKMRTEL